MLITVAELRAAGKEYARLRRVRRLPPIKQALRLVAGRHGPVIVQCNGREYTMMQGDNPCPSA